MNEQLRQVGHSAAFSAVIMLLVGFGLALKGVSSNQTYNLAVATTTWAMRIGGVGLALTAAVCYSGARIGFLLDAIVGIGAGVLIFLGAATCVVLGKSISLNDIIFCFIGLSAAGAARNSWALFRSTADRADSGEASWFGRKARQDAPASPPMPEPVHPASIRPSSLSSETPPPGGYLAALAREDERTDRADHE